MKLFQWIQIQQNKIFVRDIKQPEKDDVPGWMDTAFESCVKQD